MRLTLSTRHRALLLCTGDDAREAAASETAAERGPGSHCADIQVAPPAVNACNQGFLHNVVVTCAVGDTEVALPANCETTAGGFGITYSSATSITVAAVNT